jgi:hypothetical protein
MGALKAAFVIFYMSQLSIKETDFDSYIVKFQNFLHFICTLHMFTIVFQTKMSPQYVFQMRETYINISK